MITVDAARCKVARPCCWLLSGHADARPIGRKKWHDLHRCMLAATVHPPRPSVPARPGAAHQPASTTACAELNPHSASRTLTVPSRDFLHWPFAYAGRRRLPRRRRGRQINIKRANGETSEATVRSKTLCSVAVVAFLGASAGGSRAQTTLTIATVNNPDMVVRSG